MGKAHWTYTIGAGTWRRKEVKAKAGSQRLWTEAPTQLEGENGKGTNGDSRYPCRVTTGYSLREANNDGNYLGVIFGC